MAQSLAGIVIHILFSAKERKPWIDAVNESELHAYICGICRNLDCLVIKINGVEDHVHVLLCQTQKIINSASFLGGYGAFSVSRPEINGAIRYIEGQKERHKTQTFKEEFLTMLKMSRIPSDEKYL